MLRSLYKVLVTCALAVGLWSGGAAGADQCASLKTKADCTKKSACAWTAKACAAKAKAGAKAAVKKPDEKKPEVKPVPAEPPLDDEVPAGDGDAEDF